MVRISSFKAAFSFGKPMKPDNNPLLVGLDLFAFQSRVALAVQVKLAAAGESVSWRSVGGLRAAAFEYLHNQPNLAPTLRLVLILIGAEATTGLTAFARRESIMIVQLATDQLLQFKATADPEERRRQASLLLSSVELISSRPQAAASESEEGTT